MNLDRPQNHTARLCRSRLSSVAVKQDVNSSSRMNLDRPQNRTAKLCRSRLFNVAVRDATEDKHTLPQPNYDTNLPNTEANENQKSSYSFKRTNSYGGTKHSTSRVERTYSGTHETDKYEINRQYNNETRNSDADIGYRSDIAKNKQNHISSDDHSPEDLAAQSTCSANAVCISSFSNSLTSSDEHRHISKEKHIHEVSSDPVLQSLSTQNTQPSSAIDNYPNNLLRSCDKIIPTHLSDANKSSVEFISSDNSNLEDKKTPGFPDNSSGCELLENGYMCSSNISYHQPSENRTSCFVSNQSSYTVVPDGFIPPPTPPSSSCHDGFLGVATTSQPTIPSLEEQIYQTESKSLDDTVSSQPTLISVKEGTYQIESESLDGSFSSQAAIPSRGEQTYKTESVTSDVTDVVSTEESDSDECEESSSSENDSLSTIDVTKEQIEAICLLLIHIRKERASIDCEHVKDVVETLKLIVKKYIRGCWLELFGSYASGFAVGTSDINIALIPDKHIASSHKILQDMIKPIQKEIPDCEPVYEGDQDYRNASVSFFEPTSNICCKVRILGNKNLCYTAKLLHCFGELDSRVETLVIAVRHWAEICEIHEAENGRLHPLNYVLMMIHFLQQHDPPVMPTANVKCPWKMVALDKNEQTVGDLWLAFFKYYAETFNWKDSVVSIVSKDPVLKASKSWGKCWIAVEEPNDECVNVAKSVVSQDVSNFIKMCFLNTYKYFLSRPSSDMLDTFNDQTDDDSSNDGVSADYREDPSILCYEFYQDNFLKGLLVPMVCSTCERLGHLCDACLCDENNMLHSLPKMTSAFLHVIDEALENIYECYGLSENHLKSRICLLEKLECRLQKQLKGAKVQLIGSSKNGFGLRDSDLDACFTMEGHSAKDVDAKYMVRRIKNILLKNREFSDVMFVSTSKIPIVKFIDTRTKLRCDISIYNELAVYNTRLLRAYSMIDRRVKILGCAMKLLAKNACIDDTALRTLSSYSYILIVLYFLQQVEPPVIPVLQELYDNNGPVPEHLIENQNAWFFDDIKNLDKVWDGSGKNHQSVGELWVGLLEFYTTKFDFHHFISISQKCPLVELKNVSSSMFFNIQDPFIKNLNLGSKMSGDMSRRTLKTLQRARVLFGTPIPTDKPPSGFQSFEEYFFNPMNLTDGRVMGKIECSVCGKLGHTENSCRRYKFRLNTNRVWSKDTLKTGHRRYV